MNPLIQEAVAMYSQGMSMKDIGDQLGMSAAWVCKSFKKIDHPAAPKYRNRFSYTDEQADFVRANWYTQTAKWIGDSIGKDPRSVSQWGRKNVGAKVKKEPIQARPCLHCSVSFKPKNREGMYCSCKCMGAAKRVYEEKPCVNCGTPYMPSKPTMKYCSHECSQEDYKNVPLHVRPYWHAGVNMRSTWEVKFAEHLDSQGVSWSYEPTFFKVLDGKRYAPDFYVPERGVYYEIKGWMDSRSSEKIQAFRDEHPDIPLVVLGKVGLSHFGVRV